jgi:hypothetical protein
VALRAANADGHAAQNNGLGFFTGGRLKAGHGLARDLAFDQFFNGADKHLFVQTHQRNRLAHRASAASAADAVNVVFWYVR